MKKFIICFLIWFINFSFVYADGKVALSNFLKVKDLTINAQFTQTIKGKKKNQISNGLMQISRPNKFRWQYDDDGQLILSDGKKVYIYDKELKQVTIKNLNDSLGRSPAVILAGSMDVEKYYKIKNEPEHNGLEWVSLQPKNNDDNGSLRFVEIGFDQKTGKLAQMNFIDNFNNKSMVKFENVQMGMKFPETTFKFVKSKDVDVLY
ncbi:MAG: outer membrane lipoprotein chaperone LolA [Bacteroidia bacterium]|nr:MAG: outer membrane lipoprotein chaperone LolA [Bacteroidia bacterium]